MESNAIVERDEQDFIMGKRLSEVVDPGRRKVRDIELDASEWYVMKCERSTIKTCTNYLRGKDTYIY
jgi:hypothetical protein